MKTKTSIAWYWLLQVMLFLAGYHLGGLFVEKF